MDVRLPEMDRGHRVGLETQTSVEGADLHLDLVPSPLSPIIDISETTNNSPYPLFIYNWNCPNKGISSQSPGELAITH